MSNTLTLDPEYENTLAKTSDDSPHSLTCHIMGDSRVVVDVPSLGGIVHKVIDLEDFAQTLMSNKTGIETPILPYGTALYKSNDSSIIVVVEYPAQIVENVEWVGMDMVNIPVPRSLWFFKLCATNDNAPGGVMDISSMILDRTIIKTMPEIGHVSKDTLLHDWPYPNFSISYTPGVCWGDTDSYRAVFNQGFSLPRLRSLYDIYFQTGFNTDLSITMNLNPENWASWDSDISHSRQNPFIEIQNHSFFDYKYLTGLAEINVQGVIDSLIK